MHVRKQHIVLTSHGRCGSARCQDNGTVDHRLEAKVSASSIFIANEYCDELIIEIKRHVYLAIYIP